MTLAAVVESSSDATIAVFAATVTVAGFAIAAVVSRRSSAGAAGAQHTTRPEDEPEPLADAAAAAQRRATLLSLRPTVVGVALVLFAFKTKPSFDTHGKEIADAVFVLLIAVQTVLLVQYLRAAFRADRLSRRLRQRE